MNKAKLLCHHFATCYERLRTLDDASRADAERLTRVANDPQEAVAERNAAVAALARYLFPAGACAKPVGESFGERVDALMRERGLNQRDLAAALGMHESAVYVMISRRCRKPWRRSVKRVADALGMTPAELWPTD